MVVGKKNSVCFILLARPNHTFPFPLLFVSLEKVIFRQAEQELGMHAGPCWRSSLKGCGQENGIYVMKSTVDLKWYRQVTTAACSQEGQETGRLELFNAKIDTHNLDVSTELINWCFGQHMTSRHILFGIKGF